MPRDDRSDPMQTGGGRERVEIELGIVVGVVVDDAGHHDPVGRVDYGDRVGLFEDADLGDASVSNTDVGSSSRLTASIHYET